MPEAKKQFETMLLFPDSYFLRMRIWEVAEPVPPSAHRLKYWRFYGRPGERVVLHDNERGKGDHRHFGEREERYTFKDVGTLRSDFLADVGRIRGAR